MKREGKRREPGEEMKRERKGIEESRKGKGDVIPNFTNLEALQHQTWDAVALWCFASCK